MKQSFSKIFINIKYNILNYIHLKHFNMIIHLYNVRSAYIYITFSIELFIFLVIFILVIKTKMLNFAIMFSSDLHDLSFFFSF